MKRICKKCNKEKSINKFPKRSDSQHRRHECRDCISEWQRNYRKENKEKIKLLSAKWNYNISEKEAEKLYNITNCQICNKKLTDSKDKHIDHCHKTKVVRGILCSNCNKGIGMFKDSIKNLQNAINYLKDF